MRNWLHGEGAQCSSLPEQCRSVPEQCSSLPEQCSSLPEQSRSLPEQCHSLPEQCSSTSQAGLCSLYTPTWLPQWASTREANAEQHVCPSAVTCLIPKSAKSYDRFLSKLQQFTVDAFGPLVFIQDRLSKGKPIDQATLKAAVKAGVSLLGNATAHFSTERRKCVMKHLNSDLKPLAEGQFPDRGAYLFGDSFGTRAKAAADSVKALKGIQPRKRFLGNGGSKFKPQSRQQQWGVSVAGTSKSIFKRLGPHQGRASLPPARTKFKPRKQPPKQ